MTAHLVLKTFEACRERRRLFGGSCVSLVEEGEREQSDHSEQYNVLRKEISAFPLRSLKVPEYGGGKTLRAHEEEVPGCLGHSL